MNSAVEYMTEGIKNIKSCSPYRLKTHLQYLLFYRNFEIKLLHWDSFLRWRSKHKFFLLYQTLCVMRIKYVRMTGTFPTKWISLIQTFSPWCCCQFQFHLSAITRLKSSEVRNFNADTLISPFRKTYWYTYNLLIKKTR